MDISEDARDFLNDSSVRDLLNGEYWEAFYQALLNRSFDLSIYRTIILTKNILDLLKNAKILNCLDYIYSHVFDKYSSGTSYVTVLDKTVMLYKASQSNKKRKEIIEKISSNVEISHSDLNRVKSILYDEDLHSFWLLDELTKDLLLLRTAQILDNN